MRLKKVLERGLCFTLALSMMVGTVGSDVTIARAQTPGVDPDGYYEEVPQEEPQEEPGDEGIDPQMDEGDDEEVISELGAKLGQDDSTVTSLQFEGDFEQAFSYEYGNKIYFDLVNGDGSITLYKVLYAQATEELSACENFEDVVGSFQSLAQGSVITPGDHYVVFVTDDGGEYFEKKYAFRVTKPKLANANELKWEGQTATWSAPTETTGGTALVSEGNPVSLSYELQLYKDGEAYGDAVVTEPNTNTYDFSEMIGTTDYGSYTYTVIAKVSDAYNKELYYSSDVATDSSAYVHKDTSAPVISSVEKGVDAQKGKILVAVMDAETGVSGYLLSTKTKIDDLAADEVWTAVSDEDKEKRDTITISYLPEAEGIYYVYVKNGHDTVAKSENAIKVTKLILGNTTENAVYLIEDDDFDLSAITPAKTGYVFRGWYSNENLVGDPITSTSASESDKGNSYSVYAKWEKQNVSFKTQPADVSKIYDGGNATLTAALADNVEGNITWQWYRAETMEADGQAIDGATSSTYQVKDVADSGYYYAKATVAIAGEDDTIVTSDVAKVAITKRKLHVKVNDKNIAYKQAPPTSYEFVADTTDETADEGLAGSDTIEGLLGSYVEKITCVAYTSSSQAGDYDIVFPEEQVVILDNYNVVFTSRTGKLHVGKIDLSKVPAEDVSISFAENKTEYIYTASAIVPEVSLSYLNEEISANQYDVSYSSNVAVGTATVTLTMKASSSYKGKVSTEFVIRKADFTANTCITGWTYADPKETIPDPTVDTNTSNGTVTYYYQKKTSEGQTFSLEGATTTKPVDAGTYFVCAVIGATANYESVQAKPCEFVIARRPITITADSETYHYDGNKHTKGTYTKDWEFPAGSEDSFQYIAVTGEITNIGEADNVVSYKFSSSTKSDNYAVTLVNGKLTMLPSKMPTPGGFDWSTKTGVVNWIAVVRDNQALRYVLRLYRVTGKDAKGEPIYGAQPIKTVSINDTEKITEYSFLQDMKEDSSETRFGYAVTIEVEPRYGEEDKQNFLPSGESAKTSVKYTAKVSMAVGEGIESAKIADQDSFILVQGESAQLSLIRKAGYTYNYKQDSWQVPSEATSHVTIDNHFYMNSPIHLKDNLTEPLDFTITATGSDENPTISYETAEYVGDDYKEVLIKFSAHDTIGLKEWAVARDGDTKVWHPIEKDAQGKAPLNCNASIKVNSAGKYKIYVHDTVDNETWSLALPDIYQISFDKNDDGATGTMDSILKIENVNIELPENRFAKTGFVLKNWSSVPGAGLSSTGIYADKGSYVANQNDSLKALWTDDSFNYQVKYYYMQENGTYSESCDSTNTFHATYGASVSNNDVAIQATRNGYTLDYAPFAEYQPTVTITEQNQEF